MEGRNTEETRLATLLTIFIVAAMLIQIIRPIGVYGLRKRSDFWKLPLAGMVILVIVSGFQL